MISTTVPAVRPRRRWVRFSLRALLLLVLAIAASLAWTFHKVHEQGIALAKLYYAGCQVRFADREPLTVLERLRTWFGEEEPRNVIDLIAGPNTNDAELANLRVLSHLDMLILNNSQATDAALVHCEGLVGIGVLELNGTQVTDAGLARVVGLTDLRGLWLNNTQISDVGLAHLRPMTQLRALGLNNTRVTDAGLANIAGLTRLEGLFLDGTQVTDAGLVHIRVLPKLNWLNILGTQVTEAGADELDRALPHCTIYYGPSYESSE